MPESTKEPPLIDVKVTNPVTYLKRWWARVMGSEGVDFRFRIHPITAVLCVFAVAVAAFGAGRYSIKIPFLNYQVASPAPSPQEVWKETAFTGTLQYSGITKKYFLQVTSSSEAITLQVPEGIDLGNLIGRRIFATGNYSKSTRTLVVADAKDMEILPKSPVPIPTLEPTSTPTSTPSPTPEATSSATPTG